MNYRHAFHAANFGDVMKHVLLAALMRALQRKERGLLFLDTHAGPGCYDLASEAAARTGEAAGGIGRVCAAAALHPWVRDYLDLVIRFNSGRGGGVLPGGLPRLYPGSPRIARMLARPQDRLALGERHPEEAALLGEEFAGEPRVRVHPMDGYTLWKAQLPPPERRALVLVDPPFEAGDEFAHMTAGLAEGLRRMPAAVHALWYPLSGRSGAAEWRRGVAEAVPVPALAIELELGGRAGEEAGLGGCGLLVVNPPWRFAEEAAPVMHGLAELLRTGPDGRATLTWLVPEG